MAERSLELNGISKSFPTAQGRLAVLDGISFAQNKGEVVSIVGASGSGKTTLLRIVAGLEAPDSGVIKLEGAPIVGPGPERSLIFQQFGLMPWLNVLENVLFGLATSGLSKAERLDRAKDAIRRVSLEGFEEFHPKALSGGMQQRVGIARALAVGPRLLLCDEPFASVDAMTRQTMQTDLLRIVTEQGATVLLVTHDIEEALFLGDRVVMFSSRPARVIQEIEVAIPKPREHSVRTSTAFQEQRATVWEFLQAAA
jgi:ABC-type nitrate/sulfonate/bicarbonate transport system ATPase subunit